MWRRRQRLRNEAVTAAALSLSGVRGGTGVGFGGKAGPGPGGDFFGGGGGGAQMRERSRSAGGHSRGPSADSAGVSASVGGRLSPGSPGSGGLGGPAVIVDVPTEMPRWSLADFDDYYDGSPRPGHGATSASQSQSQVLSPSGTNTNTEPPTRNVSSVLSTSHLVRASQISGSSSYGAEASSAYVLDYPGPELPAPGALVPGDNNNPDANGPGAGVGREQTVSPTAVYADVPTYGGAHPLQVRRSQYAPGGLQRRPSVPVGTGGSDSAAGAGSPGPLRLRSGSGSRSASSHDHSHSHSHGHGRTSPIPIEDPHVALSYYLGGSGSGGGVLPPGSIPTTPSPGTSGTPSTPGDRDRDPFVDPSGTRAGRVITPPYTQSYPAVPPIPTTPPLALAPRQSSPPQAQAQAQIGSAGRQPPRRSASGRSGATQSTAYTGTTESSYSSSSTSGSGSSGSGSGSSGSRYEDDTRRPGRGAAVSPGQGQAAAAERAERGHALVQVGDYTYSIPTSGPGSGPGSSSGSRAPQYTSPPTLAIEDDERGLVRGVDRGHDHGDDVGRGPVLGLGVGLGLSRSGSAVSLSDAIDYSRRVT